MENVILISAAAIVVAIAFMMFGVYAVYGGFKADLSNAKVGQVFNFEYLQPLNGESKRVLAKVLEPVHYLSNSRIDSMNRSSTYRRNDKDFLRTNHLVTCETVDGEIRQFYCERVRNCRKPIFGTAVV